MRQLIILLTIGALGSCATKTDTIGLPTADSVALAKAQPAAMVDRESLPGYVANAAIPDSLLIDARRALYGDFNNDQKKDFASIVTNSANGFQGVLIVHDNDQHDFFVFGAGQEIDGMKNLDWIDIFKTIPKGEVIAPTLVDEGTGDIIGADETRNFRLIGDAIYMHVDEACGGGILFWTGQKYDWYHLE